MVVRVGRETRVERGRIGERAGLLGQAERGAGAVDLDVVGVLLGHTLEGRARGRQAAARDLAAGEPGQRLGVARLVLEQLLEDARREIGLSGRSRLLRLIERELGGAGPSGPVSRSTNALIWLSGRAPAKPSTG